MSDLTIEDLISQNRLHIKDLDNDDYRFMSHLISTLANLNNAIELLSQSKDLTIKGAAIE